MPEEKGVLGEEGVPGEEGVEGDSDLDSSYYTKKCINYIIFDLFIVTPNL